MTADYERIIEDLTAEYEKAKAHTGELRRKISELTATATAPRETVKVTVGAQGEVRSIEFPTSAYKRMAPAELSAALMAVLTEARDKAQVMLSELMAPSMPAGVNFLDMLQGKVELPDLDDAASGLPSIIRDYLAGDSAIAAESDRNESD